MNRNQIGNKMDTVYNVVYIHTNANEPVKLVYRNGTIKVGFFQPTKDSDSLELENKYTFVVLKEGKDKVTIVDGNDLINVQWPSQNGNDLDGIRHWDAYDVLKNLKISLVPACNFSKLLVDFRNSYLDAKHYTYRRHKHRNPVEVDKEVLNELYSDLQHIQNRAELCFNDFNKKSVIRVPAAVIEAWQSDKHIRSLYDALVKYCDENLKQFNVVAVHVAEYRALDKLATILRRKIKNEVVRKFQVGNPKKIGNLNQTITLKNNKTIGVFISYSWDTPEHENKVLQFTDHLRKKGFDAKLDKMLNQHETAINFKTMMFKAMASHEKIVVVLSEGYKRKADAFTGGVGEEYQLMINDISASPRKYVFVSFQGRDDSIIPFGMRGRDIIDLSTPDGEKGLFRKLSNQDAFVFSEIAPEIPNLPPVKIGEFNTRINKSIFHSEAEFKKQFKALLIDKNSGYYSELKQHWNTYSLLEDSVVLKEIISTSLNKSIEYGLLPMINDFVAEHLNYDSQAKYVYNSPHVYMHVNEDEGYNLPVYYHIRFVELLYATAIINKIDIDRVANNYGTMRSIFSSMVKYMVSNIERKVEFDDLEYPSNYHWLIGEILGFTDNWVTLFNEPENFNPNFSYTQDFVTMIGYCFDELYHGEEAEKLPDAFVVNQVYYHALSTYFSSLTNDEMRGTIEENIIKKIPKKLINRILKFSLDEKFALSVDQFVSGRFRTISDREKLVLDRFRFYLIDEGFLQVHKN